MAACVPLLTCGCLRCGDSGVACDLNGSEAGSASAGADFGEVIRHLLTQRVRVELRNAELVQTGVDFRIKVSHWHLKRGALVASGRRGMPARQGTPAH